jgi:hypothetical protein
MANGFSKAVQIAFDEALIGFEDKLIVSANVSQKTLSPQDAERTNNTLWEPMPYIMQSYSGTDMSANFLDVNQLSVPLSMGYTRSVPFVLSMANVRDTSHEAKLVNAAIIKLASDINKSVVDIAAAQGSMVIKRTTAADIAQAEIMMTDNGIPTNDRFFAMNTKDYNGVAKDLQVASRSLQGSGKSLTAYEKAYVGEVATFTALKSDYMPRIIAAAGGSPTISTLAATTANHYLPRATATYLGQPVNVDNRFHQVTVSATASVLAGDAFTIANCYCVHPITKASTGVLKTFRVVTVDDGTHLTITPPIISNQQTTSDLAAAMYKNCNFSAFGATAAITWLNTAAAGSNIFWQKEAIILMPGRYNLDVANDGVATMNARTENGIEIIVSKQRDIKTGNTYIRADTIYGAVVANTEMVGVEYFSQT